MRQSKYLEAYKKKPGAHKFWFNLQGGLGVFSFECIQLKTNGRRQNNVIPGNFKTTNIKHFHLSAPAGGSQAPEVIRRSCNYQSLLSLKCASVFNRPGVAGAVLQSPL